MANKKMKKGIRMDCVVIDEQTEEIFKQEDNVKVTLEDGCVIVGKITAIEYNDCIDIYCHSLSINLSIDDFYIVSIERNEVENG